MREPRTALPRLIGPLAAVALGMSVLVGCGSSGNSTNKHGPTASKSLGQLVGAWTSGNGAATKFCEVEAKTRPGQSAPPPAAGSCLISVVWSVVNKVEFNNDASVSLTFAYQSNGGSGASHTGTCVATATVKPSSISLGNTQCKLAAGDSETVTGAVLATAGWKLDGKCLTVKGTEGAATRFARTKGDCTGPDPTIARFAPATSAVQNGH